MSEEWNQEEKRRRKRPVPVRHKEEKKCKKEQKGYCDIHRGRS